MSLTSQIRDKNSPIRRFLRKYENAEGRKECLRLLQSTKPLRQPLFTNASAVTHAFAGTTSDYLIRYFASGNRLVFENTIAHQALKYRGYDSERLNDLYAIGKQYLDGRDASDTQAIYSATALAMLDNVFRSGRLPELFLFLNHKYRSQQLKEYGLVNLKVRAYKAITKQRLRESRLQRMSFTHWGRHKVAQKIMALPDKPTPKPRVTLSRQQMEVLGLAIPEGPRSRFLADAEQVEKNIYDKVKNCPTETLFHAYYQDIGGELYTQDVSELVKTFMRAIKDSGSELYNARLAVPNWALANSCMVGGADFDCVLQYGGRMILTDIKATTRPLVTEHFRQLLGYALLYDEIEDDFTFSDVGIYHSRSGSFRFLPLDIIIQNSLPDFQSVTQARKEFISEIQAG